MFLIAAILFLVFHGASCDRFSVLRNGGFEESDRNTSSPFWDVYINRGIGKEVFCDQYDPEECRYLVPAD